MEESLKAALELRRDGNLLESKRLLDELISQHPEHAMLHYECAWSCDILKQEEDAISLYQRALKLGLPKKEAINAYVQTGSLYRQLGQFAESEKILMEGMLQFWEVGLLKVFYAFIMYDLGKPGEAMRWMTHALLDSTENQEIFLNQRVIGYVGSNLDIQNPGGSLDLNIANKVEIAENRKTIIEKVDAVLKVFEPTYFHGAWVFEFDRYDLHFTDSNNETRRAAVAAFAIMVGIWETGSAQSFMPQHERKYSGDYNPLEPHFELNGYINAFYSNFNNLQQEFPIMTAYTIDSLGAIDERSKLGLDKEFPEIDSTLFEKFRQEILLPNRKLKKKLPPFDEFLEEIG
ncbi:tetratricopeptide repeat protein [Planococcus halocryophilus]|uniref:tetratricopeptide repeat protein n=1 Tax=Planococcus halocryophilus TaxID=1215089 RepID=UPI001F0D219E|nr:tetratricopeptide repeat protein [Planococcus halocryophilus]MCH4827935.1 tetratricopeptide repeat protein [Planococcus halocryophilus]